jgi:hypothetical protein
MPGWGLHPLESAAFARRAPKADIAVIGHRSAKTKGSYFFSGFSGIKGRRQMA